MIRTLRKVQGKRTPNSTPGLSQAHVCGVLALHLPKNIVSGFILPRAFQREAVKSLTIMHLGGIMLSEKSETQTNTAWHHFISGIQKRKNRVKLLETE